METLRPNGHRAKITIILIWIVLALHIASIISGYLQYELLQDVSEGTNVSVETADANDLREQIIAITYVVAMLVSAIWFIMWFRRAYYNLGVLVHDLNYPEGWAAGSWFVPFINLIRPYQIMKEIYTRSKEILFRNGHPEETLSQRYLILWWTLWVITSIADRFIAKFAQNAESLDELINATILSLVLNIVSVPLCFVTVKVISDYSSIEPILASGVTGDDSIEAIGTSDDGNDNNQEDMNLHL